MHKPILSFILCSRNDQYMGNSHWRLQTTLNYIAQQVHELKREEEVEVLVADWGSEIPLREVLVLSHAAARIVSFVHIPPEIARDLQKDSSFPEVLALNAAARRAGGEYIGRIDQDTLVGKRFLEYFFALYEGRRQLDIPLNSALLFANRRSIPYRFAARNPQLNQVELYIRIFGQFLKIWRQNPFYQDVFWTSYVGIWLLHRELWNACGGYDERLIYYNWMEADMIMRLTESQQIFNLGKITGYDFYHLEHYNPRAALKVRVHGRKNPDLNPSSPPKQLNPNGENWGLIKIPLEILMSPSMEGSEKLIPVNQVQRGLPAFFLLILTSGIETVYDNVLITIKRVWLVWRSRALTAEETIRGEHFTRWPRLLLKLWIKSRPLKKTEKSPTPNINSIQH